MFEPLQLNPCVRPIGGIFTAYEPRVGAICCIDDGSGGRDHFISGGEAESLRRADQVKGKYNLSFERLASAAAQHVLEAFNRWPSIDCNTSTLAKLHELDETYAEQAELLQSHSANDAEAATLLVSLNALREKNTNNIRALEENNRRIVVWSQAVKNWKRRLRRLRKLIDDRLELLSEHMAIIDEVNKILVETLSNGNESKTWAQAFNKWEPKSE